MCLLRPKTMPKQLPSTSNQLSKSQKDAFFDPENGKNDTLRRPNFELKF